MPFIEHLRENERTEGIARQANTSSTIFVYFVVQLCRQIQESVKAVALTSRNF